MGKSVVALALAKKLAGQGKKTLLVELGTISFFKDYLELSDVEHRPRKYADNLFISLWSGWSCLSEYTLHLVKVEKIKKLFMQNPVSKALIDVAPTLAEVAILGKITSGPRKVGPPLEFDVIVIDGFASGHFVALLKAPIGMAQTISFGPMGEQCRGIVSILKDPAKTKYFIVSTCEELPITESLELNQQIQEITGIKSHFMINKSMRGFGVDQQASVQPQFKPVLDSVAKNIQTEMLATQKLTDSEVPFTVLPMVLSQNPNEIIPELSRHL